MKAIVMFDTQAMPSEVKSNLGAITKMDGVSNLVMLEKSVGEVPQYCLQLDLADDMAESFQQQMRVVAEHYGKQASNFNVVIYRTVFNFDANGTVSNNPAATPAVVEAASLSRKDRVKQKLGLLKKEDPNIYPLW